MTMAYNFVIGLAGPYAAGCSTLSEEFRRSLVDWPGCHVEEIHVAQLIEQYYPLILEKPLEVTGNRSERRKALQTAGTELRKYDLNFIGKAIAVEIYKRGWELENNDQLKDVGTLFFIIDSLKNINDVKALKRIYSDEFFLLFLHANKQIRWRRLKDYKSWLDIEHKDFDKCDDIDSDERVVYSGVGDAGQQVSKLSSIADYYIVNDGNREKLKDEGMRLLHLLLGDGFIQPTIHEHSMHLAFSASNRSYCLSRQVGAVITDQTGNVLGIGYNDVPKPGGGLYIQNEKDMRCYLVGDRRCINDTNKQERFVELRDAICKQLEIEDQKEIVCKIISKSSYREATEYCRAVHAEMEALLSMNRISGRSTVGSTMYVTTQPCHNCTKHILCAGIKKVYYIEPYPKSLAEELHSDAIILDPKGGQEASDKLFFIPFQGVSPHCYHSFFSMNENRKDAYGMIIQRTKEEMAKAPRFSDKLFNRLRKAEKPDPITVEELAVAGEFAPKVEKEEERKGGG
jgi:deoxycytidylate deaminase